LAHEIFEQDEVRSIPRRESLAALWPLFRPRLLALVGAFVLLLFTSALMVLGPLLVRRAIDVDIAHGQLDGLRKTVALYLLVQLVHLGVTYLLRNWLESIGQGIMAGLKRKVFDHLMRLPAAYYDKNPPGRLIARVENDTQALRMLLTSTTVMLAGDLFLFIAMFVVMARVDLRLTFVTASVVPILLASTVVFQKTSHPIFVSARRLGAEVTSRLTEFVQGIVILRAYERRRWAAARFREINTERFRTEWRGERLVVIWSNSAFLMQTIAFALILGLGGRWALEGTVTIGTLVLFMGYVRRFFEPLFRLSEQLAVVQKALAASERILLLLRESVTVADPPHPKPWPGLVKEIAFENVWFRYAPDGDWVLKDVSFRLPAGEKWALVGPTGSGKTTIVSLLLRFYDPERGSIRVDGVDVREIAQETLRSHVGLVLQDIYLFPGTLEANLRLGREASREAVENAARVTLAHKLIERLPNGFATDLAERGTNLSVGERQLLSFTRAVLGEPPILILDEATSAVDPATEALITRATTRLLANRTALIIAHRLSTIRHCSTVLVLQHGQLVEKGSHEELLRAGGLYQRLHSLQFRDTRPTFAKAAAAGADGEVAAGAETPTQVGRR